MEIFGISFIKVRLVVLFVLSFVFSQGIFAQYKQTTIWPNSTTSTINTGVDYVLIDNERANLNKWDEPNANTTLIAFKIDQTKAPYTWFKAQFTLDVTPIQADGSSDPSTTYPVILLIESNYNSVAPNFNDLASHQIINRYGAKVRIMDIELTDFSGATPQISHPIQAPLNVQLEISFNASRSYRLDANITPTVSNSLGADGTLQLDWPKIIGAFEYELEWTWVDRFNNNNGILSASDILFSERDFELNNTRIRTNKIHFEIPLIYQKGFLLYRLRALGKIDNDAFASKAIKYSKWTSDGSNKVTVADWPNVSVDNHDKEKNWQFQASYAENGKKKEVVSYFDGSLRNRQTVTKTNTDNTAIVGEVIYDFQGRPAIEVLPVPILYSSHIRYYNDLNKNIGNQKFTYRDFDLDPTNDPLCSPILTPSIAASSGAGQYYSNQNIGLTSNPLLKYVPDAEGYPFSQTVYTPDNTGRISNKGGVGKTHQIGVEDAQQKSHEMKYIYTVPEQAELNRLFGYSVGDVSHYKKNIVVDPNGQISVSYIDPKGKTIATALSGGAPNGMAPLPDNQASIQSDLLNKIATTDKDTDADNNLLMATNRFGLLKDQLEVSKQLGIAGDAVPYTFIYKVANSSNFTPPNSTFLGSSCNLDKYAFVYDFNFKLKDNCGVQTLSETRNDATTPVGTKSWGSTAPTLGQINIPINGGAPKNLKTGNYSLLKELKVNEKALQEYVQHYVQQLTDPTSTCYVDPENFVPQVIKNLDCNIKCSDFLAEIGEVPNAYVIKNLYDYYQFNSSTQPIPFSVSYTNNNYEALVAQNTPNNLTDDPTDILSLAEVKLMGAKFVQQWELLHKLYLSICDPKESYFATKECESNKKALLKDVSPSGQYGKIVPEPINTILPLINGCEQVTNDTFSVFNSNNNLYYNGTSNNHNWKYPDSTKPYKDENGELSTVRVNITGINSTDPPVSDFLQVTGKNIDATGQEYGFVKPQYLSCVKDFLYNWQDVWAESLLIYHPEHNYLEFTEKVCDVNKLLPIVKNTTTTSPDGIVTISYSITGEKNFTSDDYDNYLEYLDFGAANFSDNGSIDPNSKFFNIDGFTNSASKVSLHILNQDPFFSGPNTTIPNVLLGKNIMTYALTNKFDNFGVNMLKAAYRTMKGYAFNSTLADPYDFDNLSAKEKNKLWAIYKNYYKSLKARVKSILQNAYAYQNGSHNACVGVLTSTDYIGALRIENLDDSANSTYKTYLTNLSNLYVTNVALPLCNGGLDYSKKEKRFQPVDVLYNSTISGQNNVQQMGANAAYQYYASTGNCPMVQDLEVFLKSFFAEEIDTNLTTSSFPLTTSLGNYVTEKLFKKLCGDSNWIDLHNARTKASTADDRTLTFSFQKNGIDIASNCSEKISLTLPAPYLWGNYRGTPVSSGQWNIQNIYGVFYDKPNSLIPNKYAYKLVAMVYDAGLGKNVEIVLNGTTCLTIGECGINTSSPTGEVLDPGNASMYDTYGCNEKTRFLNAFTAFFKKVKGNTTVLANEPLYRDTFLAEFFGETGTINSTWQLKSDQTQFQLIKAGQIVFAFDNPWYGATIPTINSILYDSSLNKFNIYTISGTTIDIKNSSIVTSLTFDCCTVNLGGCRNDFDCDGVVDIDDPCPNSSNNTCLNFNLCTNNSSFETDYELKLKEVLNWFYMPQNHLAYSNGALFKAANISSIQQVNQFYFGLGLNQKFNKYNYQAFNLNRDHYGISDVNDVNDFKIEVASNNLKIKFRKSISYFHNGNAGDHHHYDNFAWQNVEILGDFTKVKSIFNIDIIAYDPSGQINSSSRLIVSYFDVNNNYNVVIAPFYHYLEPLHYRYHPSSTWWSYVEGYTSGRLVKPFCNFIDPNSSSKMDEDASMVNAVEREPLNDTSTTNYCKSCIPQPVEPVSGTEKYRDYETFFNFHNVTTPDGIYQFSQRVTGVAKNYIEKEFIDASLQYNWEGYKKYIEVLNIASVNDPRYISIVEFSQSYLKYGYKYLHQDYIAPDGTIEKSAVDQYALYSNPIFILNTDSDLSNNQVDMGWIKFINEMYEIPENGCAPRLLPSNTEQFVLPPDSTTTCDKIKANLKGFYGKELYLAYIESLKEEFKQRYIHDAMANVVETFDMSFNDNEYQYTLYYYDQAGNLTQTVAPEGVHKVANTQNSAINNFRKNDSIIDNVALQPVNSFKTQYRYNSLNQLVWQSTPDGGETRFAYDKLGRIIASQNANQDSESVTNNSTQLGNNLITDSEGYIYNTGSSGWNANNFGYFTASINGAGYIERTVGKNATENDLTMLGFTHDPNNTNLNLSVLDDVEKCQPYAFYIYNANTLLIKFRNSAFQNQYENTGIVVQEGDKLKLERINGTYNYYVNGVLINTKQDYYASQDISYASFFIHNQLAKIKGVKVVNYDEEERFSYTKYDDLGRITEAGQIHTNSADNYKISDEGQLFKNNDPVDSFENSIPKTEVTRTVYDKDPYVETGKLASSLFLSNKGISNATAILNNRNRVSGVYYHSAYENDTTFDNAIFYNYDVHGNVKELVTYFTKLRDLSCIQETIDQGNGELIQNDCEVHLKRTLYDYDLISGNVHKVTFQPNKPDQFIHQYEYDADNRIVNMQTSKNGVVWEKDAAYQYYPHGPLARVELGNKKVQGLDYAYTLQGWLKGVNGENLVSPENTMNQDGSVVSGTQTNDAFGYSLSYYDNDYKAINSSATTKPFMFSNNIAVGTINNGLYNGNIRQMTTAIRTETHNVLDVQKNNYQYDQLNRIVGMTSVAIKPNESGYVSANNSISTSYKYDRNGNLQELVRNAFNSNGVLETMDNLKYDYQPNNNKLGLVKDLSPAASEDFDNDLEDQQTQLADLGITYDKNKLTTHNYIYDEIGQLIEDKSERIKIEWRVDGKVKKVIKNNVDAIEFEYDGLGNRIAKRSSTTINGKMGSIHITNATIYSRDAQGNVLGLYNYNTFQSGTSNSKRLTLKEHHLYGSSRIGIEENNLTVYKKSIVQGGSESSYASKMMMSPTINSPVITPIIDYALHFSGTSNSTGATWNSVNQLNNPQIDNFKFSTKIKLPQSLPTGWVYYNLAQLFYQGTFNEAIEVPQILPLENWVNPNTIQYTQTTSMANTSFDISASPNAIDAINLPCIVYSVHDIERCQTINGELNINTIFNSNSKGYIEFEIGYNWGSDVPGDIGGEAGLLINNIKYTVYAKTSTANTSNVDIQIKQGSTIVRSINNISPSSKIKIERLTDKINFYINNLLEKTISYSDLSSQANVFVKLFNATTSVSNLKAYQYVPATQNAQYTNQVQVLLTRAGQGTDYFPAVKISQYKTVNNATTVKIRYIVFNGGPTPENTIINDGVNIDFDFKMNDLSNSYFNVNALSHNFNGSIIAAEYSATLPLNLKNQIGGQIDDNLPMSFDLCYFNYELSNSTDTENHSFTFDNANLTDVNGAAPLQGVSVSNLILGPCMTDVDQDGIYDAYEDADHSNNLADDNTDGDTIPVYNYLDTDDDGDGILTKYEDGDLDGDHVPVDAIDTDGDGIPNYLDVDDDGDGIPTWHSSEGGPGIVNSTTLVNGYTVDSNGDGTPNYLDSSNGGVVELSLIKNNFRSLVGDKRYELSNHLGNVLAVVSDRKIKNNLESSIVYSNIFSTNTTSEIKPWVMSVNSTSMTVENRRLKVVTAKDLSGVDGYYNLIGGITYNIGIDVDKSQFDYPLEFSLWKGTSKIEGKYVTSNTVSTVFTPPTSGEYRINFRLREKFYAGTPLTFFIDNVKIYDATPTNGALALGIFNPDVVSYSDYYPFGSLVPNRHGSSTAYRYGFSGVEKDDELKGEGNSYDFGARMFDPRIGRFFAKDPDFEDYPSLSPYVYADNSPLAQIDFDGKGPRPAPKMVEAAIYNFGEYWFRAFKAANNTSTGHFNDWVRGRAGSDGRAKAIGAMGEGTWAASIDNTGIPSPNTVVKFGSEIYGKSISKVVQVDVVEITVIGTYKGKLVGGGLGKKIVNYSFNGTEKSPIQREIEGTGMRTIVQNYEVKTLNPDSNISKLYDQLSKGIDQAIKNGFGKNDDIYGVLVTDKKSWQKVANDKTYGKLLEVKYNKLINSGNVLRLQEGLYKQTEENLNNLIKVVKDTPE